LTDQPSTLVLFDIDGTLLHSSGCGRAAMELTLREVFGHADGLDNRLFAGSTDWQVLIKVMGLSVEDAGAKMPAVAAAMTRHLAQIIGGFDVRACVGAHALVEALAREPRSLVGLLTGNIREVAPVKLRAAGFAPAVFKVGAYGSEAPRRDMLPPLAVERAGALTGVRFEGKRVVIIGDTPNDVACGRGVGARSIAVLTGHATREALVAADPDYLFEDLTDIEALTAAIFA
jgi:phosphoglycolate phosphatase-like HAD superfamily hydrolase